MYYTKTLFGGFSYNDIINWTEIMPHLPCFSYPLCKEPQIFTLTSEYYAEHAKSLSEWRNFPSKQINIVIQALWRPSSPPLVLFGDIARKIGASTRVTSVLADAA